ncbi:MAG: trigger factor, partial [Alphaproteobacteria bacterium]
TVPATELSAKVESKLSEIQQSARLPGFRPGKVPVGVLRKRYGQALLGEALQETLETSVQQTIEERGLRPAMQPKVEVQSFAEGGDLEYTVAMEVLPDIQAQDFSAVQVERLKARVDESEVDKALERVAGQHKRSAPIAEARPAAAGDIAVVDFEGSIDGKPFPGGGGKDFHLELGSGMFIPGFEDGVIGHSPGETFEVGVTFPAEYGNRQLAGKPASFEVTIKELRAPSPAAVDEELAKQIGFGTLQELRDATRQEIEREFGQISRIRLKRVLLDQLAGSYDFAVPEGMVDMEFETIWRRIEEQRKAVAEGKAEPDADDPDAGKDEETLKADYRKIAERRVRLGLLLAEVGRVNNINVSDDELGRAVAEEARRYPGQERKVAEFYQKTPQAIASLRAPIFEDKVVDFILEMAKVSDREVSIDELLKEPDEAAAAA